MRTPGPWHIKEWSIYNERLPIIRIESETETVAEIPMPYESGTQADNAAFIVEACNAHDRLTAENERLRSAINYTITDMDSLLTWDSLSDGTRVSLTNIVNRLKQLRFQAALSGK